MNNIFQNKLNILCGKEFCHISRCIDLVCLGFGNSIKRKNRFGDEITFSEYSFHIQCPFKITLDNCIILSNKDMYIPNNDVPLDLSQKNICLFDEKAKKLLLDYENEYILSVLLDEHNNVTICTSNFKIEIFSNNDECESWRFFAPCSDDKHIVVDERGIVED